MASPCPDGACVPICSVIRVACAENRGRPVALSIAAASLSRRCASSRRSVSVSSERAVSAASVERRRDRSSRNSTNAISRPLLRPPTTSARGNANEVSEGGAHNESSTSWPGRATVCTDSGSPKVWPCSTVAMPSAVARTGRSENTALLRVMTKPSNAMKACVRRPASSTVSHHPPGTGCSRPSSATGDGGDGAAGASNPGSTQRNSPASPTLRTTRNAANARTMSATWRSNSASAISGRAATSDADNCRSAPRRSSTPRRNVADALAVWVSITRRAIASRSALAASQNMPPSVSAAAIGNTPKRRSRREFSPATASARPIATSCAVAVSEIW